MSNLIVTSSVVADFERLLQYIIAEGGIPVGDNHALFKMQTLKTLNSLLTNPIKEDQKRPVQKNFPQLHALNALLRFSGLTRVIYSKKGPLLHVDFETFHSKQRKSFQIGIT